MLSILKKLFGLSAEPVSPAPPKPQSVKPPPGTERGTPEPVPGVSPTPPVPSGGSGLVIPLKSINLPPELASRFRADAATASISIPVSAVLRQLPSGTVKLSFGELRRATSPNAFNADESLDGMMVKIPLQEVVSRLDPGLLARKPSQKQIDISPEIAGPFGGKSQVSFSTSVLKTGPEATPAESEKTDEPPAAAPAEVIPAAIPVAAPAEPPISISGISLPRFSSPPPSPIAPPNAPVPSTIQPAVVPDPAPKPAVRPPPPPAPPTAPLSARIGLSSPTPQAQRSPVSPFASTPKPPSPVGPARTDEARFLSVPLKELSKLWPDLVRQEIGDAAERHSIALPWREIEAGMKRGKAAFPWRLLRSWARPPLAATTSPHDESVLELPLAVVIPLFVAELGPAKTQKRVTVDPNIPALFPIPEKKTATDAPASLPAERAPSPLADLLAGLSASMPETVESTAPDRGGVEVSSPALAVSSAPLAMSPVVEPANAPPIPVPAQTAASFLASPTIESLPTPATASPPIVPTKPKPASSPNELVARAGALDGIAGVMILLSDGFMVASKLPPDANGGVLAAFAPQILNRVGQSAAEMKMGPLNRLSFTVGAVSWEIFRSGSVLFAAFGKPDQTLPSAALAGIAAELDKKKDS